MNQKGFAHLLLLTILLLGLGAGVYLVQSKGFLNFQPKAGGPPIIFKDENNNTLPVKLSADGKTYIPYFASPSAKVKVEIRLGAPLPVSSSSITTSNAPISLSGGGSDSPPVTQIVSITPGESWVGLNVYKGKNYNASDLLEEINNNYYPNSKSTNKVVSGIYHWNPNNQNFERYTIDSKPSDPDNFPILPGEGYRLNSLADARVRISGPVLALNALNVYQGKTFISLPVLPVGITTAEQLLQAMKKQGINVKSIEQKEGRRVIIHNLNSRADNFDLTAGKGYFITSSGPAKTFQLTSAFPEPVPSAPAGPFAYAFKISENYTDVDFASVKTGEIAYTQSPTVIDYEFQDKKPGIKTIWVKYKIKTNGVDSQKLTSEQIELVSSSPTPTPTPQSYDLDVAYIERTPRYPRYCIHYNDEGDDIVPRICPGKEDEKHNPAERETVAFSAKVINKGETRPGNFTYHWFIDGIEVQQGQAPIPAFSETVKLSTNWVWKNGDHKVKLVVDAPGTNEINQANNQLEDYTNGLSYRIHVEKSVYGKFNSLENIVGTRSFEDWVQYQMKQVNTLMAEAGGNERFRIDEIVVENDNSLSRGATHAPDDIDWDGRWGFETTEWLTDPDRIAAQAKQIRYDLIHEWGHQVSLIDSYNLNFDGNYIKENYVIPHCKDFVHGGPILGTIYENCVYFNPELRKGIMNGGSQQFVPFEAQALNSSKGFRRGYFGEYMFDIPAQNIIKIVTASGSPLVGASVSFYQSQGCNTMPDQVIFSGTTNRKGEFPLPNRKAVPITTATGHTLRDNPFGTINRVGCNGIFLIKIEADGQTDYRWMDISFFNLAYWRGETQEAKYTVTTSLQLSLL